MYNKHNLYKSFYIHNNILTASKPQLESCRLSIREKNVLSTKQEI